MSNEKKNSAFQAGIGYTVGNILVRCIGILTLPLFSRIMSPDEFGVFNVFVSYDAILCVIVGFAMHTSVRSAGLEFKGRVDDYVSSISLIYLLNALVMAAAVLVFGDTLSVWLGFGEELLYMLILYSLGIAVLTLYNTWISLSYSYKQYLLVALVNSLGNVALSLTLILTVYRERKAFGRILGATVVITLLAIFLLAAFYRRAKPRFDRKYWSFALKYSLPIVPHGISQILLAQFDRVMIRSMVSDAAAGIYSLAGNIKLILTVINSSIADAWSTWFYGEMDRGNRTEIRKRAAQLAALFTILTVGLMALAPELVFLLGGEEYELGKFVAIPMILDGFILFLCDLICTGEYYAKKTVYIMLGTVIAAVLNVVLNYVFILRYGFIAAAYTTLVSYVCYLLLHLVISRRFTGFCIIPGKWLVIFGGIVTAMAAADLLLIDSLPLRWSLCAAVVIPMGLLLLKDMGGMKTLLNRREGFS